MIFFHHQKSDFIRDAEGSTLVEFAMLVPLFLMTMFGIIELGLILFASTVLENAVSDASRFGKTGAIPQGVSREAMIRTIIENNIDALLDPDKLEIDSIVYDSFGSISQPEPFTDDNGNSLWDEGEDYTDINGNGQWDPDMGAAGAGGPGDVVVYRVDYPWDILTPIMAQLLSDDGVFVLSSNLAVRNEPFGNLGVGGGP